MFKNNSSNKLELRSKACKIPVEVKDDPIVTSWASFGSMKITSHPLPYGTKGRLDTSTVLSIQMRVWDISRLLWPNDCQMKTGRFCSLASWVETYRSSKLTYTLDYEVVDTAQSQLNFTLFLAMIRSQILRRTLKLTLWLQSNQRLEVPSHATSSHASAHLH